MKTLSIPLDEMHWQLLEQVASERRATPEQLVLEAIEVYVQEATRRARYDQALQVVGKYHSEQSDVSARHDAYLAQDYLSALANEDESIR
ncbi:MAG: hypothetical protein NZM28_00650 [Fimbriimonadales bacterium]|nr:hypothetical protein [Fimbriimonadales bacterium]